ncbi:MAG: UDP-N-acetylmuramoyl-tripeptide--D-alanyl-D-alanine ligase [Bacillaceae bacterium]|nr:UDP-N-acetylmuramoyl-tripeptide--D-alanyl-D-alanine ligase [Bacillaceae bacterium]
MYEYTVRQIAEMTGGTPVTGNDEQTVRSVHFDSRLLEKESLFVALTEGKRDGHRFLPDALKRGATAALISDPAWSERDELKGLNLILVPDTLKALQKLASAHRDKLNMPLIAVTGSNGKTTTKDMIAHLLESRFHVFKTYKNYNNHLGVPLSLLQINPDHEAAVLEMGMNHYGEIDLLASLARPTAGVITNVNDAHIEYFGSRENIAKAKGELLPHVHPDGYVLLNGDDPYVTGMSHLYPGDVIYYGIEGENELAGKPPLHIWARGIHHTDNGTAFEVRMEDETLHLEMPLFGMHNVSNLLPAIWIARKEGCSPEQIREAVRTLHISAMRFELLKGDDGSLIINDAYNASPASMKQSISTFKDLFQNRKKVLVLGDMYELGPQTDQLHAEIGSFLNAVFQGQPLEMVVTVGEHTAHLSSAYEGNKKHFTDKAEAVSFLKRYMNGSYALLFKASRGMELEQVIRELREG